MKMKQLLSKIAVSALTLSMLASFAVSAEEAEDADGAATENAAATYVYEKQGFDLIDETFINMLNEPKLDQYQSIAGSGPIFNWMGGRSVFAFYSGGTMVATDPEKAIFEDSPSLVFYKTVDTRAWMLADFGLYPDPSIVVELTMRVDNLSIKDDTTGFFQMCITEDQAMSPDETGNEAWGGKIFIITPTADENVYELKNNNDEVITTINKGEVYKLSIVFVDETEQYHFFLNDEYVAGSESTFKVPVTLITAFRFDMNSPTGAVTEEFSEVTMGKILFDTCDFYEDDGTEKPDESDDPVVETDDPAAETEDPTAEPTEAPTATPAPTQAPTTAPTEAPVDEGGCGSVIGGGAAMVALMGLAVVALKKRH